MRQRKKVVNLKVSLIKPSSKYPSHIFDMDIYSDLGNKIRVKLVLCLVEREKCAQEMIDVCGLAQSAVSQHLEKLRKAGIVAFQRK